MANTTFSPSIINTSDLTSIGNTTMGPPNSDDGVIISYVLGVIFVAIIIIGLIGNLLVTIVIIKDKQMKNTTNVYIFNLAMADLLVILFTVPISTYQNFNGNWIFGEFVCQITYYLQFVTLYISIYTLVLMSVDRYLAVVHAIKSMSYRTASNALISVVVIWVITITVMIPVPMSTHLVKLAPELMHCAFYPLFDEYGNIDQNRLNQNYNVFLYIFLITSYVIPLLVITVLYMVLLRRIWEVKPGGNMSAESQKSKRRVTRMVVAVITVFAVCCLPMQISFLLQAMNMWDRENVAMGVLNMLARVMVYSNSAVNPIIYAFMSDNFRQAFAKLFPCLGKMFLKRPQNNEKSKRYGYSVGRTETSAA